MMHFDQAIELRQDSLFDRNFEIGSEITQLNW